MKKVLLCELEIAGQNGTGSQIHFLQEYSIRFESIDRLTTNTEQELRLELRKNPDQMNY